MRTTLRIVLAVAVRVVVLLAAGWAYSAVYDALPGQDDSGLGEGLLAFLLLMAASAAWGAWDGDRRGLARATAIWVPTAVLAGAAMAFVSELGGPGMTLHLMLADVRDVGPFLACLIGIPAVVFAALAAAINRASRGGSRRRAPGRPARPPIEPAARR